MGVSQTRLWHPLVCLKIVSVEASFPIPLYTKTNLYVVSLNVSPVVLEGKVITVLDLKGDGRS